MLNSVIDSPKAIFLPAAGMAFWTIGCLVRMGIARNAAVTEKKVSMSYYATYDPAKNKAGGGQHEPEELVKMGQYFENLTETPPIWYAAILATYALKDTSKLSLGLAWGYLLARIAHGYVMLGSNNVLHRFITFITSIVLMGVLWGRVVVNALDA
jgi:hypothetical protein